MKVFRSSEITTDWIKVQQDVTSDSCVYLWASEEKGDAEIIMTKKDAAELGRYLIQLAGESE